MSALLVHKWMSAIPTGLPTNRKIAYRLDSIASNNNWATVTSEEHLRQFLCKVARQSGTGIGTGEAAPGRRAPSLIHDAIVHDIHNFIRQGKALRASPRRSGGGTLKKH